MTEIEYFEDLYRTDPDPWRLASAPYETRKRAITMASLPRETYRRGFEPACAGGELTTLLAGRCEEVVATDPVLVAVGRVRERALPNVEVAQGSLPHDWPSGAFDLVVLGEILYFLDEDDRARTCRLAADALEPGGHLLAVHWRHDFQEAASRPDEAHDDLLGTGLHPLVLHEEADFRLEVLERA